MEELWIILASSLEQHVVVFISFNMNNKASQFYKGSYYFPFALNFFYHVIPPMKHNSLILFLSLIVNSSFIWIVYIETILVTI